MAKTAAERKREQRERERMTADRDRVDVVIGAKEVMFLKAFADYKGFSQGDVVEEMINTLWRSMSRDDERAMWAQAEEKREADRARRQGDTKTIPLFLPDA